MEKMKLEDEVICTFKVAREFTTNTEKITGMDFFPDGKRLVSCSKDDTITIYNCEKGTQEGIVNSKKYGVDLIQFGNDVDKVVYASTKVNDTMRYLSLSKKCFIRYFFGHTKKVVSLCSSPNKEKLLTCSLDNTLRLWDIRSPNPEGFIPLSDMPVVSFHPQGIIFAVGVNSEIIKLYDIRSYTKGPFLIFNKIPKIPSTTWTGLKFSADGKHILINTTELIRVIDSFSGISLRTFSGHLNTDGIPLEASYSPDSKYIFSGSTNGRVHVWNAEKGHAVCVLNPNHPGPIGCLQFNPILTVLASTCDKTMALWLPGEINDCDSQN